MHPYGGNVHQGPAYPALGESVAKWRRVAQREGLMTLDLFARRQYAEAIEKAIRALQRSELMRVLTPIAPETAYGAKLREKQRKALLACPAAIRRARKPHEWEAMYEEAMKEKRG